jgi:acetoin utilization protein AcuB
MLVSEMMQKRVVTADVDVPAETAWRNMLRKGIRHLVVLREGRVVGVVSDRDMEGARGPGVREGHTVGSLMTPGVVAAAPDTSLPEAAGIMRRHRIHSLPVMDDGKLCGILTTTDVLDYVIGGGRGGVPRARKRAGA